MRPLLRSDVAIIGGGPIGLELAAGFKHAGTKYLHCEAGAIGATIGWWAPETRFFSSPDRLEIAGVPLTSTDQSKTSREQYLAYLRGVAAQHDLRVKCYTRVSGITRSDDGFTIATVRSTHGVGGPAEEASKRRNVETSKVAPGSEGMVERGEALDVPTFGRLDVSSALHAERVVLAIGDMHRPRMLNVPGEDLPHVSHYLGEVHRYFGQRVLIVGGKNSAVEAALRLHRCGARVTISYRGETFDPQRVKYWLRPELEWLISKKHIAFHPGTAVQRIERDCVHLCNARTGEGGGPPIAADQVLLLTGYEQDATLFEQLGIELVGEERAPKHDPTTMETNVPGVYVAGTAAAGSQTRARVFIENSHVHVQRIVKAIAGHDLPWISDNDCSALAES